MIHLPTLLVGAICIITIQTEIKPLKELTKTSDGFGIKLIFKFISMILKLMLNMKAKTSGHIGVIILQFISQLKEKQDWLMMLMDITNLPTDMTSRNTSSQTQLADKSGSCKNLVGEMEIQDHGGSKVKLMITIPKPGDSGHELILSSYIIQT
jgi:hypothetical protein